MNDRKPLPSPWAMQQAKLAEARERDRKAQVDVRERAQQTADRLAAQDAQEAKDKAAANEVSFRVDEKAKYLAAGGSVLDFDLNWPRLRQHVIEQRYLSGDVAPKSESDTAAAVKRHLDLLYKRT